MAPLSLWLIIEWQYELYHSSLEDSLWINLNEMPGAKIGHSRFQTTALVCITFDWFAFSAATWWHPFFARSTIPWCPIPWWTTCTFSWSDSLCSYWAPALLICSWYLSVHSLLVMFRTLQTNAHLDWNFAICCERYFAFRYLMNILSRGMSHIHWRPIWLLVRSTCIVMICFVCVP